jgi:hypothetical protein
MPDGDYQLLVHQYTKRETSNVGFDVEIEFDGNVHSISYPKAVRPDEKVAVATIRYTEKDGFKIIESLPTSQASKVVWNIPTQTFHKVQTMMFSPNHWNGKPVGNRHYFFMLENCQNEGKARGFFNEFLTQDLDKHRKVLEICGSKVRIDESENQLSGLGFSSTRRNHIIAKVKGSFQRVVKITF